MIGAFFNPVKSSTLQRQMSPSSDGCVSLHGPTGATPALIDEDPLKQKMTIRPTERKPKGPTWPCVVLVVTHIRKYPAYHAQKTYH